MANIEDPSKPHLSELQEARLRLTQDDRLQVEFRIDDLVRRLIPPGELAGHCGGCNGCMGCSH